MAVKEKLQYFSNNGMSVSFIARKMGVEVSTLSKWLRGEKGMTFVIVTHELDSIFKIADRCAMFDKARRAMIALGDPKELKLKSEDVFVRRFFNRGGM